MSNPEDVLEPSNKIHFATVFNIQLLCSEVLPYMSKEFNNRWLLLFNELVMLSSRNTLICPFYDLLATLLRITDDVHFFKVINYMKCFCYKFC